MMTKYFSALPLPECAMKVNGKYLERIIVGYRTSFVSGRNELSSELFEKTIGDIGPTKYLYKKDKTRDILVRFALVADNRFEHEKLFNELKSMLHADDSKFIFDDEPNVYYIGTVKDITCEFVNASGSDVVASVGNIVIHCSVPYKYSEVITTVAAQVESGKLVAHVDNDSSCDVYPIYRIKHKSENGYIGIVHTGGAFEMGNIEEADGSTYQQSEALASLEDFISLPDDHGTNFMHPNHVMNGTLITETINGTLCLKLKSIGGEKAGKWCGGMRTLTIPPDSEGVSGAKNFYCYLNHWFETGLMGQTAEQSIAFLTADNKLICGYSLFKADMTGNTACLEMWANGKVLRSINYTPSYLDEHNPYNNGRGHSDIYKEGDKIRFFWFGSYPVFTVPEVKNMECHKIQIAFTQYAGRGIGNQYVTRNYLRSLPYRKFNVEKWKDEPNRYPRDSEVVVNCEEDCLTVNGLPRNEELVTGSGFYALPPGKTDIEFYTSSWCKERPEITVEFRKRWL